MLRTGHSRNGPFCGRQCSNRVPRRARDFFQNSKMATGLGAECNPVIGAVEFGPDQLAAQLEIRSKFSVGLQPLAYLPPTSERVLLGQFRSEGTEMGRGLRPFPFFNTITTV